MGFGLFAWETFAALGGMADCAGVYETVGQAKRAAQLPWGARRPCDYRNVEVVDLDDGAVVAVYEDGTWRDIDSV